MCCLKYSVLTVVFGVTSIAQTFSSGSTGADGALDLTSGNRTVVLPPPVS